MRVNTISLRKIVAAIVIVAVLTLGAAAAVKTGYVSRVSRSLSMLSAAGPSGQVTATGGSGSATGGFGPGGSAPRTEGRLGAAGGEAQGASSAQALTNVACYAAILAAIATLVGVSASAVRAISRGSASPRRRSASAT